MPTARVLPQLPTGAVRLKFEEILATAPAGLFAEGGQADALVDLPLPEVLRWKFGPRAGVPSVQTRIRLATSQIVTAVAKMRDGTFRQDSIELLVTLAACIDD